jgi:hypothetical protein
MDQNILDTFPLLGCSPVDTYIAQLSHGAEWDNARSEWTCSQEKTAEDVRNETLQLISISAERNRLVRLSIGQPVFVINTQFRKDLWNAFFGPLYTKHLPVFVGVAPYVPAEKETYPQNAMSYTVDDIKNLLLKIAPNTL